MGFLLSAALAVIGFAFWVAGEHGPAWRRVAVAAAVALAVYLTHYAGIVALGLCLAGYEGARWWRDRREIGWHLMALGLPFVLPLVLAVAVSGDAHPGQTTYDPWRRHLSGLLSATMFPGSRFDMAILAFVAMAVAAGLATLLLPGAPLGL